ncbi:MAG: lysine N(6)-hydroxylase/L-ornithine N(5)-oxygenase family protein [Pseudonocardia sp.]
MAPSIPTHVPPDRKVLDLVGVGFGPSNLALAIALAERGNPLSAAFVERQERFGWHRGMLLDDATMRISFLKDLVTLRDPTSPFTFLAYLHERGRLVDFINYGSVYPTRLEFHDYLEWAAGRCGAAVDYGTEILGIHPVRSDAAGPVDLLEIVGRRCGITWRRHTRNVVLATGLTAHLPPGVQAGPRIWHNRDLLLRVPELDGTDPTRFVVVGAGQSAAEAVDYLHRTFPGAEICSVFGRYGYSPADDSSFANRIFDPAAVDDYFHAPEPVKEMLLGYHANTNYSVVDPELIDGLYRRHYHEKVAGAPRLRFLNVARVGDVVELPDRVELCVESLIDARHEVLAADVVVYATGYRPTDPLNLFAGPLADAVVRDDAGCARIRRDYRVETAPDVIAGIYVQGATEHSHGITSTLLSTTAVRVAEILGSLGVPAIGTTPATAGGPAGPPPLAPTG